MAPFIFSRLNYGDGGITSLPDAYSDMDSGNVPWFPTCHGPANCFFEMAGPSTTWGGGIFGALGLNISPWASEGKNANFILNADNNSVLSSQDAYIIDNKMDDGNVHSGALLGATTGRMRTMNDQSGNNCLNRSSDYDGNQTNKNCILGLQLD